MLIAVNSSERKKPPTTRMMKISITGVVDREQRAGREKIRADEALIGHHVAEAEGADDARRQRLHAHRADRGGERHQAGLERRPAEADLHQQRQQERQRAEAEPEQEPPMMAARIVDSRSNEIQHRRSGPPRMHDVDVIESTPTATRPAMIGHGSRLRPATERPKAMPASPMPASTSP